MEENETEGKSKPAEMTNFSGFLAPLAVVAEVVEKL